MASNESAESGLLQDKLQEALEKATRVLSNLHRVQSYLEIIKTVSPNTRAPSDEVVKNALEQMRIIRTDTAGLLQTVYLTEIGLQSLQDFSKQGASGDLSTLMPVVMNSAGETPPVTINSNQGEADVMVGLSEEELNYTPPTTDGMPPPLKKINLGVTITTCSTCSRKFATQCSDDDDDVTSLCRNCRPSAENELESTSTTQHQALQLTPASVSVVASDISTVACFPTVTSQIPILSSTPLKQKPKPYQRRRRSQLPPLNCKICGFCFIYRRCLLRHLRETHTGLDMTNLQQYIEMGKPSSVYTIKEGDAPQMSPTSSLNVTVGSEIPSNISLDGASMETHPHEATSASVLQEESSASILEENLLGQAAGINPTSPTSAIKLGDLDGKDSRVDSRKQVERTYVCVVCSKGFDRPYRLQRHMYIHNPNRPHVVCQICDRQFTRMDTLDNHMKSVHSDERPFSCTTEGCLKTFATQSALFHHLKTHMNGKPYKCLECEASFALLNEYKQHMRENHADTRDLRCSDCYKLFPTNASLQEHKLVEHRLECEICGRSFARLAYLQAHIEVHNGDKLYNCKHCSSGFDTEYAYKQHIKVHPEQHRTKKMYQCQLCDKTFHHSSNLVTHYRSPEHRDKANELGLNSGSILPTIEGDLSADMSALVDEVTMGTEEGDNIMQTIAESEAFQATAAAAAVSSTSNTGFVTSTATSEPSLVGFESSSEPHILPTENPMPS